VAFAYFTDPIDVRGLERVLYPVLRGVIVGCEPDADAVLPATYDDASPEERESITSALEAFTARLCGPGPGDRG